MQVRKRAVRRLAEFLPSGLICFGLLAIGISSCATWSQRERTGIKQRHSGWPKGGMLWREQQYASLQVDLPVVPDAILVDDDSLCMTCHEGYTKAFANDVHRQQKCESCHGPASRHLETRGSEPGLILSFKTMTPAQQSEACLKCHEAPHVPEVPWRTSAHAHNGVGCTDCHTSHYNVLPGTPATSVAAASPHLPAGTQVASLKPALTIIRAQSPAETIEKSHSAPTGPLQRVLGSSVSLAQAEQSTELPSLRGTSNNLGAITPQVCYRCHSEMRELEEVAHPHQIGGVNGFNCTTCHDPHGNIVQATRKDNCLECHQGAPTMAWHSSIHEQSGVACADCHNAHPSSKPQRIARMSHTSVDRPKRLPMSVDEPEACYQCHQKIYGLNSLPSHHPIKEGKMVCSDCHDAHGANLDNLKEQTVNLVCWKCHAETQGPFVYEHPPVTEDCMICHEPHGTVQNNLLRQPTTFLCLRCHAGHRSGPGFHDAALLPDIGNNPSLQGSFFTDCTQCHSQVHGSDLPSPREPGVLVR